MEVIKIIYKYIEEINSKEQFPIIKEIKVQILKELKDRISNG